MRSAWAVVIVAVVAGMWLMACSDSEEWTTERRCVEDKLMLVYVFEDDLDANNQPKEEFSLLEDCTATGLVCDDSNPSELQCAEGGSTPDGDGTTDGDTADGDTTVDGDE